ncbi:MAG: aquaglyceroporin AqpS [Acidimicrobiales bacterium]
MPPSPQSVPVRPALWRRTFAEFLGSTFLAAIVIGSGIAAQRLSPNDVGLQLFENAAATAVGLVAIILTFGPVSGAHFNPVVSLADRAFGGLRTIDVIAYIPAQIAGCSSGAIVANRMFHLPFVELSTKTRTGGGLWLAEVVATVGLLLVIFAVVRSGRAAIAPFAVGAYIGGAYFWTASTSFANPAIVVGRMLSNTFAGIKPSSAPGFVAFQLVGLVLSVGIIKILYPGMDDLDDVAIVPAAPPEETRVGHP